MGSAALALAVMAFVPGTSTPLEAAALVVRTPVLKVAVGTHVSVRRGWGRLDIEVAPERAKVYVDGRYVGRGDARLTLRAGAHRVRVVLGSGRAVEAETVHVEAGRLTRAYLDLD
jgi:hypothetical protein